MFRSGFACFLGRPNTGEEVEFTIAAVAAAVRRLRDLMPAMTRN